MIAFCDNCEKKTDFMFEFQGGGFVCGICGRELMKVPGPGTAPARRQAVTERVSALLTAPEEPAACPGCAAVHDLERRVDGLESKSKESRRRTGRRVI